MTDIQYPSTITVEEVDHMGSDLSIARAAWVSTGSDDREPTPSRVKGVLRYLMEHRHGSPFEHATLTVRVHAPIMVFREWHRHRVQSYNEQSGRYTQFEPVFYLPGDNRPLVNVGTSARPQLEHSGDDDLSSQVSTILVESYTAAWESYQQLLGLGVANEVARLVLPVGTFSSMYATANVRAWLHFISLRTSEENATYRGHPQYEIVMAAQQVEAILREQFPITLAHFDALGRVAP